MAIRFPCSACKALLSVDDKYLGKKIKCGKCLTVCVAELPQAVPPPPPPVLPELVEVEIVPEEAVPTAIQTEPKLAIPMVKGARDSSAAPKGSPPLPKNRAGGDAKGRPDRRGNRKPASSSAGLWIFGLVLGLGALGVFALLCVGIVGWAFFVPHPVQKEPFVAKVKEKPFDDVRKEVPKEPWKNDDRKIDVWPEKKNWPEEKKFIDDKTDPFEPKEIKLVELPAAPIVAQFPPVDPAKLALKSAALEGDMVTRQLPATMDDLVVGGGGRFLLFTLPSLNKVGMFDANEGKVVHYFPAAESDVKIAAGLTKLVIAYPTAKIIQRWDLLTKEKELTTALPDIGSPRMVLMGSASQGPVLVVGAGNHPSFRAGKSIFLNLGNFKEVNLGKNVQGMHGFPAGTTRVSANGTVFGCWEPNVSPQGLQSYVIVGNQMKGHYQHKSMGHINPGPDGKVLYTASGMFTNECQPIGGAAENKNQYVLPAVQGNFYLTVNMAERFGPKKNTTNNLSIHIGGDSRPLVHLNDLIPVGDGPLGGINRWDREKFGNDKRFLLIPDADLLVVVPLSNDRLELRRINIEETLEKSGIDYLYVISRTPEAVQRGTSFNYKLNVKSKKGGLKYKLDAGPNGMKVSTTGVVVWPVDADHLLGEESVLLTVSDAAGQEVFHSFKVHMVADAVDAQAKEQPKDLKFEEPKKEPIGKGFDPPKGGAQALGNIKPVKLDAERVERKLPASLSAICIGGGGRFLLVTIPGQRQVALFDANEGKIVHYFPLAGDNARVAAGREHMIVAYPDTNTLQRWNLLTREKELTAASPFQQSIDSLTMGYDSAGPIVATIKSDGRFGGGGALQFLDLKFKTIDVAFNSERPGQPVFLHASPDGTLFGCRDGVGGEPHAVKTFKLSGANAKGHAIWPAPTSTLVPAHESRFIYSGSGIFTPELQQIYPQKGGAAKPFLPALHGPYFMRLDVAQRDNAGGSVALFFQGNYTPFATIDNVEGVVNEQISYGTNADLLTFSKRVFLIPGANLLVSVPTTNDRLVLNQVDMDQLLEKSPIDYLLVASSPPSQAKRGEKLVYKLDVRTKKGGLRFNLDAGPQGMVISPQGELTWTVPADHPLGDENIIVTIRDAAGQEVFHTFRVRMGE